MRGYPDGTVLAPLVIEPTVAVVQEIASPMNNTGMTPEPRPKQGVPAVLQTYVTQEKAEWLNRG